MSYIYFVIRHKATGLLMPQAKKDRGYSHWNPAVHTVDNSAGMKQATDVPRLLSTRRKANKCIIAWAANPNGHRTVTTSYYGEQDDIVDTKPDGRKADDLEVVEVSIVEFTGL